MLVPLDVHDHRTLSRRAAQRYALTEALACRRAEEPAADPLVRARHRLAAGIDRVADQLHRAARRVAPAAVAPGR
ncbi:hypothetical protein DT076_08280 [Desertihabitans brevis]|uniref:Uncharacterized protein n=1 Tax=Desertihabitans brevis TaxID=2268447 RepID=A0A367YVS6_9ACTN|nr:hypothetical protein [Desertihabitans brevis]RCK69996.1 hypothetical protein DT076_08280 [Desertihabitans brevis]